MTKLFNIDVFSHQGKRENNEDSYFPNYEIKTSLDNLFLVCDGVGGLDKGEIASDLCCSQLSAYFSQEKIKVSDETTIDNAIKFLEKKFDSYMKDNPESMDMASTITLLHLHSKGATVAHMGDSRVYHIRNGKILFRTKDHSVVQELFEANIITEEDMATHRDRNRISRAMRGASVKSYKADTTMITDLKEGDLFFLCSDGVLESFSDSELEEVFSDNVALETFAARLVKKCNNNSSDNYTGLIVQLTQDYIETLEKTNQQGLKEDTAVFDEGTASVAEAEAGVPIAVEELLEKSAEIQNEEEYLQKENAAEDKNEKQAIGMSNENQSTSTAPIFDTRKNQSAVEDELKDYEEEDDSHLASDIVKNDNKKILLYGVLVIILVALLSFAFILSKKTNKENNASNSKTTKVEKTSNNFSRIVNYNDKDVKK